MNRFLALWHRLFPSPFVQLDTVRFVQVAKEHEAAWHSGYNVGRAQGQLEGRQALSDEFQQEFGLHAGQAAMTADDAARIKARQVH